MAEFLVVKVDSLAGGQEDFRAKEIFYYEHFAVFHEKLFQESRPKSVITSTNLCDEFTVVPGIYELVLSENEEGQPTLISAQFLKPVDHWQE